jgi:hypothetical protein
MHVFISLNIKTKEREWDWTTDINIRAHMSQTKPFRQKHPFSMFFNYVEK